MRTSSSYQRQRGESLLGLLSGLAITCTILTASTSFFLNSIKHNADIQSRTQAQVEISAFLDAIGSDLRMAGSGVPLTQTISDPLASSWAQSDPSAVLEGASSDSISFRLNETGVSTFLTAPWQPSPTSVTVQVASSAKFRTGETVYFSNFPSGQSNWFKGLVASQNGSGTINLVSSFNSNTTAVFPAGSLVHAVKTISYASLPEGASRVSQQGSVIRHPRVQFQLTYLDSSNIPLAAPLSAASIKESLAAVTVRAFSARTSRFSSEAHTIEITETLALRNLNLSR